MGAESLNSENEYQISDGVERLLFFQSSIVDAVCCGLLIKVDQKVMAD